MKKLLSFAAVVAMSAVVWAEDDIDEELEDNVDTDVTAFEEEAPQPRKAVWPAFFGVGELPDTPDLVGLRLTIPLSTKQESVTGIDLGFWGESRYYEGIQINLLRNKVIDRFAGVQVGIYNTVNNAELLGVQVGLWNEANALRGVQAALINTVGQMQGVQVGVINRAEELYGVQIGLINVIRSAELTFCPIVNIGF